MKHRLRHRFGLSLLFSLIVLFIFLTTSFIVGGVSLLIINSGAVDGITQRAAFTPVLMLLFASIAIGTFLSLLMSKSILRPLRKIVAAINELAAGNFSARLDIRHPPEAAELTESFNRMAGELGSTEMLRADFVNNFSHEFKTPIVSIKGFAEMVRDGDLTEDERNEYLDVIISESSRLASLATNVLNLSKVENQTILAELSSYNVGEQIRKCVILLQSKWEKKNIEISADGVDVYLTGNEELLGQVWLNLLDNAIKFAPEGGSISLEMSAQPDGSFAFSVTNGGAPISAEALPHIFDKFYQGDTSHAAAGNGLGLTLAKRIVELHKGSVFAESTEEAGTTITVVLPVTPDL